MARARRGAWLLAIEGNGAFGRALEDADRDLGGGQEQLFELVVHLAQRDGHACHLQRRAVLAHVAAPHLDPRSEEHTSELQSRENLVCRLLLDKKNWVA